VEMTTYDVMILSVTIENRKTGEKSETKFKIREMSDIAPIIQNMSSKRVKIVGYACSWIKEVNI